MAADPPLKHCFRDWHGKHVVLTRCPEYGEGQTIIIVSGTKEAFSIAGPALNAIDDFAFELNDSAG